MTAGTIFVAGHRGAAGRIHAANTYPTNFIVPTFFGSRVVDNLNAFKAEADVIVANRVMADLEDVRGKVYTWDVYGGMREGWAPKSDPTPSTAWHAYKWNHIQMGSDHV